MDSAVPLTGLDAQIAAALLAHPRARVGTIAAAIKSSSPTVSRRLTELLERRTLRVIGVLDQQRAGVGFAVFLRLRCSPGTRVEVARALARWPEAGYVGVLGGDFDCAAQLHLNSSRQLLDLTDLRLRELPGVTASSTLKIIRRFATPHGWTGGLLGARELATLRAERVDHFDEDRPVNPNRPDEVDRRILAVLAEDGRISWRDLGERVGVQAATASRRAEALMSAGLLRFRTVVQPGQLGQPVTAMIWLRVAPSRLEAAGRALACHPQVVSIAATTGQPNLCGEVALRDDRALYAFLTDDVGGLPGVAAIDVSDGLWVIKRGNLIDPVRIDQPEVATLRPGRNR